MLVPSGGPSTSESQTSGKGHEGDVVTLVDVVLACGVGEGHVVVVDEVEPWVGGVHVVVVDVVEWC